MKQSQILFFGTRIDRTFCPCQEEGLKTGGGEMRDNRGARRLHKPFLSSACSILLIYGALRRCLHWYNRVMKAVG